MPRCRPPAARPTSGAGIPCCAAPPSMGRAIPRRGAGRAGRHPARPAWAGGTARAPPLARGGQGRPPRARPLLRAGPLLPARGDGLPLPHREQGWRSTWLRLGEAHPGAWLPWANAAGDRHRGRLPGRRACAGPRRPCPGGPRQQHPPRRAMALACRLCAAPAEGQADRRSLGDRRPPPAIEGAIASGPNARPQPLDRPAAGGRLPGRSLSLGEARPGVLLCERFEHVTGLGRLQALSFDAAQPALGRTCRSTMSPAISPTPLPGRKPAASSACRRWRPVGASAREIAAGQGAARRARIAEGISMAESAVPPWRPVLDRLYRHRHRRA